ncbi:MAG: DUF1294 domain-containing protein [Armatimonadota bacterium]
MKQVVGGTGNHLRHQGRITNWNDERGFGFVVPENGGERAFLHINAFERKHRRPVGDEIVSYELRRDEKNRPQAAAVRYAEVSAPMPVSALAPVSKTSVAIPICLACLGFLLFVGAMAYLQRVPDWVPFTYAGVSVYTYMVYGEDKSKAIRGGWRTPESTLHLLELLGGWPGALAAQQVFRHKSRKEPYQLIFWGIVALHIGTWIWLAVTNKFH